VIAASRGRPSAASEASPARRRVRRGSGRGSAGCARRRAGPRAPGGPGKVAVSPEGRSRGGRRRGNVARLVEELREGKGAAHGATLVRDFVHGLSGAEGTQPDEVAVGVGGPVTHRLVHPKAEQRAEDLVTKSVAKGSLERTRAWTASRPASEATERRMPRPSAYLRSAARAARPRGGNELAPAPRAARSPRTRPTRKAPRRGVRKRIDRRASTGGLPDVPADRRARRVRFNPG
jgi:hypothetical protein